MQSLHFMGIGGIGMSGLARWFHAEGYAVSGCDMQNSSEVAALRAEGMQVCIGHDAAHVLPLARPNGVAPIDTLISSMAVPLNHPEIQAALQHGTRTIRRIELLAELFKRRQAIGITGTHGKSTTTGMTALLFLRALTAPEQRPSVLVGAQLPIISSNVTHGHGPHLVAEVDESDPGFAELKSELAVITNLEADHIAGEHDERRNYHSSFEELQHLMQRYASAAARVLYCADWPGLTALVASCNHTVSYGMHTQADYRICDVTLGATGSTFTLCSPAGQHRVELRVPGEHNILNATAALASAHLCGLDLAQATQHITEFEGVGRRWQRRGSISGALMIDDYAHHPTEIRATLNTARQTGRRVRAVLQPHRWVRTAQQWPEMAEAASLADEVVVVDIYGANETPIAGISPELIVARIQENGVAARHHTLIEAQAYLTASLQPNDLIITLGAGDIWQVAQGIVDSCGGDDGSA